MQRRLTCVASNDSPSEYRQFLARETSPQPRAAPILASPPKPLGQAGLLPCSRYCVCLLWCWGLRRVRGGGVGRGGGGWGGSGCVNQVSYTPCGRLIVIATHLPEVSKQFYRLLVWSAVSGRICRWLDGHTGIIHSLTWKPFPDDDEGDILVTGSQVPRVLPRHRREPRNRLGRSPRGIWRRRRLVTRA